MTELDIITRLRTFDIKERSGDNADWLEALDLMDEAADTLEGLIEGLGGLKEVIAELRQELVKVKGYLDKGESPCTT